MDDYELNAAIRRIRDLHQRTTQELAHGGRVDVCSHCTSGGDPFCYPEGCDGWPCSTIAALIDVEV